jgi:hypothetical protein
MADELCTVALTSQVESQGGHARIRKFLLAGLMKINPPVDLAGVSFEFSSVFQLVQRDVPSKPLDLVAVCECSPLLSQSQVFA